MVIVFYLAVLLVFCLAGAIAEKHFISRERDNREMRRRIRWYGRCVA